MTSEQAVEAGSFYDRIADLYDITFKFNGYSRSLEHYLRAHPLPLEPGARILDAGCGTGLLTFALMKALKIPVQITAVDLSASSLAKAKRAARESFQNGHKVHFGQANVLALPFADESFDMVVTSGVLEYVPLQEGFGELARVIAPGGHLLHLPIIPTAMSKLLELMFRFKTHPPEEVEANTRKFFRMIANYRFPPLHPIGWTKTAILSQKL